VIAAGKAAASMAAALTANYGAPVEGIAVTRYGHGGDRVIPGIDVLEAGHPVVDQNSVAAGRRALALAGAAGADDRVIVLLSGGASAVLECPRAGLELRDLAVVNHELLDAGADIRSINAVRRQLSALKGGGLAAAAWPADIHVLAISDVPDDRLADIGSGPCSPEETGAAPAREILRRFGCRATPAVWSLLEDARARDIKPSVFGHVHARVIVRPADAVAATVRAAAEAGFEAVNLGADVTGAATDVAAEHARLALDHARREGSFALISGGETTVRVRNPAGRGGRNSEYALALAIAIDGASRIRALAADTDGIDGTGEHAGAFADSDTVRRAARLGLSARELLAANRSYDCFAALGDLFVTGPTLTNVNDLRVILIG